MSVDLDRPPARLGPRVAGVVTYLGLFLGLFVAFIVIVSLLSGPIAPEIAVLLFAAFIVVISVFTYVRLRLMTTGSIGDRILRSRGFPLSDPDAPRRPADREEIQARHQLRKGEIRRSQYETVIAHRRFVHGEITEAEYRAITQEMSDGKSGGAV